MLSWSSMKQISRQSRRQIGMKAVFVVSLVSVIACAAGCRSEQAQRAPATSRSTAGSETLRARNRDSVASRDDIEVVPRFRTIRLSYAGFHSPPYQPWEATIDDKGDLRLQILDRTMRQSLSTNELATVEKAFRKSRFLGFTAHQYGPTIVDGAGYVIEVDADSKRKTVRLGDFRRVTDAEARGEIRRFIDLWLAVRRLFNDPEAYDETRWLTEFVP